MAIPQRFLSADEVKAQIARLLTDCPELREDDEGLLLSLESETDAVALCEKLMRASKEAEYAQKSITAYRNELKLRRDRLAFREEKLRDLVIQILNAAGRTSLPTAFATGVITRHQKVNIVNRHEIPEKFRRYPEWEPKLQEIKDAIKSGEHVIGCTLSNPEPSLSIRVK